MAEAFANYYGKGNVEASSAGNKIADKINPIVIQVMNEKGLDISTKKPKLLTFEMANNADLVVTMGCSDSGICPGPFFKENVDWKLENPKGKPVEKVREIRDQIEAKVQVLIEEISQKKN